MEELIKVKINSFLKTVRNFNESLDINLDNYSEKEKDLIKNGQVQKFEYTIELMWKTLKDYLDYKYGLDSSTPKGVVKYFFEKGQIDYGLYEKTISAIDDRNKLSHIYKEEMFENIYRNLKGYGKLLEIIAEKIIL